MHVLAYDELLVAKEWRSVFISLYLSFQEGQGGRMSLSIDIHNTRKKV